MISISVGIVLLQVWAVLEDVLIYVDATCDTPFIAAGEICAYVEDKNFKFCKGKYCT